MDDLSFQNGETILWIYMIEYGWTSAFWQDHLTFYNVRDVKVSLYLLLEDLLRCVTLTVQSDMGPVWKNAHEWLEALIIVMYAAQSLKHALYDFLICLQGPLR